MQKRVYIYDIFRPIIIYVYAMITKKNEEDVCEVDFESLNITHLHSSLR